MQFVRPIPFIEALAKLGQRLLISSGLNSAQWASMPLALRERAFFSSTIESVRFLQRGRDAIADFLQANREQLPDGSTALKTGSRAQFVRDMQRFAIAEGMEPLKAADAGTLKDIRSQRRLELIFATQTRQAADYGYWKQGQDPDVLNAFPAQRFIRVVPVSKERDHHRPFEDQVFLKSNLNMWQRINRDFGVPWGPWGWGCGHDVEDVDRADAEQLGLLQPGAAVQPVEMGFNERLEASLRGLAPDMINILRQGFGDQVEISGDTARWKPADTSATSAPAPGKTTAAALGSTFGVAHLASPLPLWADESMAPVHGIETTPGKTTAAALGSTFGVAHLASPLPLWADEGETGSGKGSE